MIAGFLIGLFIMFILSLFEKDEEGDSTNPYL